MNAPEKLYFQDWDASPNRRLDDDTEYVRADLYEELRAELRDVSSLNKMTVVTFNGLRHRLRAGREAAERAKALKAENDRLRSIVTVYVREKLAQEMNGDQLH